MSKVVIGGISAVALVAVLVVVGIIGRTNRPSTMPGTGELRVVTTTPVLYSLTAKVLGRTEDLGSLVPPGASPENYGLRPQDAEALARADVLVVSGLGFERFLDRALGHARAHGVYVIVASEGVLTRGTPPDPHVWVDPLRAAQMVQTIADGLASATPAAASSYQQRAGDTRRALEALDSEFRTSLAAVPRRQFIAFHPAWGYFAERYGLEQVAVIEEFPGKEPTAQELGRLITLIRNTGVRAVFSEPQFSSRVVEALARDLGLTVAAVNPEGGELAPDGYERLMRANVAEFVRALSAS